MKPLILVTILVSLHLGVATAAAVGPSAFISWVAEASEPVPTPGR